MITKTENQVTVKFLKGKSGTIEVSVIGNELFLKELKNPIEKGKTTVTDDLKNTFSIVLGFSDTKSIELLIKGLLAVMCNIKLAEKENLITN